MKKFPKIHIVGGGIVENKLYHIYAGYKDGEVVCLALSLHGFFTINMLRVELSEDKELCDATFEETQVSLNVYHNPTSQCCREPVAKLRNQKPCGELKEALGGSFLTEDNEQAWREALGMMVIFSPL